MWLRSMNSDGVFWLAVYSHCCKVELYSVTTWEALVKVFNSEISRSRLATLVILVVGFTSLENYAYAKHGLTWAGVFFIAGVTAIIAVVPKKNHSTTGG